MTTIEDKPLNVKNPTIYKSNLLVIIPFGIVGVILLVSKILIAILNEPHIGYEHYRNPSTDSFFVTVQTIFWFNLLMNIWPLSWLFYGEKERTKQFCLLYVIKSWSFLLFIVDITILVFTPYAVGLDPSVTRMQLILVCFAIIPCGLAYFYIVNSAHILTYNKIFTKESVKNRCREYQTYDSPGKSLPRKWPLCNDTRGIHSLQPNENCAEYILDSAYMEFEDSPKTWTIKEAGAFRIILENVGVDPFPANTELYVERLVQWNAKTLGGRANIRTYDFSTRVKFPVKFEEDVPAGKTITLIPETHEEPGAINVQGYRSFGNVQGLTVTTSIISSDEKLLTKFTQKFKCNDRNIEEA